MLRPMRDHVLVERIEDSEYQGLLIVKDDEPSQSRGKILAVSNFEEIFNVGDDIMFGKNSGTVLEFENTKYFLVRNVDIMAKVKNN
jgi:chaperonin GroES